MASRRCSFCGTNWPASTSYETCIRCLEPTDYTPSAKVNVSDEEIARAREEAKAEQERRARLPDLAPADRADFDADWVGRGVGDDTHGNWTPLLPEMFVPSEATGQ